LLEAFCERFELDRVPRRIEVYDNSHISGTNAVGAMIVAGPEGFVKGQYRKFNIKCPETAPGDDYAMMREMLTRRFKRLVVEETALAAADVESLAKSAGLDNGDAIAAPATDNDTDPTDDTAFPDRPDVVLIDGGQGQLSVAREVFDDLGITDIKLIGVAKGPDRDAGREHFHVPGRDLPMMLEMRDPVLYFVQRLRDEAHRFAIGTHRAKRARALGANPLDDIEGIGPTRKRTLLKHFGSAKAVSRAGIEDLKTVPGISADLALKIYDFFHERR